MPESAMVRSAVVGIVMGSDSDWPTMEPATVALDEFEIPWEADVVSAHRMPEEMVRYGREAHGRGLRAIIAGAGGAAHLPGMLASLTPLPVIGVPFGYTPVPMADLKPDVLMNRASEEGPLVVVLIALPNPLQPISDLTTEQKTGLGEFLSKILPDLLKQSHRVTVLLPLEYHQESQLSLIHI